MTQPYSEFLAAKAQLADAGGFEPVELPDHLFDFQRALVEWAVRQGRAALFADCGMGKTPMELAWAEQVHRQTGKPVLLLTPLAVGFQIVAEAHKFGHCAALSRNGKPAAPITVTNYEQAAKFNPADFGGVVCDESSAIKAFDGTTRAVVTELMRELPYRLLGTATAAPNDYLELGTSSEALGELGYMDMLGRFFVNEQRTSTHRPMSGKNVDGKWIHGGMGGYRFKGHAETPFWRWVSSWARAIRKPSDYGYSDDGFRLPELREVLHVVESSIPRDDMLFDAPAVGLAEERADLRRSLPDRCEKAAELVESHDISVIWCNLNDEGDLLERLIPRSIQVKGSDSPGVKEKAAEWFTGGRCICNDPDFRAKLAAWDGSPSTRRIGSADTTPIQRNAPAGSPNLAAPKPTPSTCASTTELTQKSSSAPRSNEQSATGGDASATPATPNIESASSSKRNSHQRSAESGPFVSTASPQLSTTDCSASRTEGVLSAESSSATPAVPGSPSIIVTKLAESAACYAATAIKGSASSLTTQLDLTAPHCTCGHADGRRRLISKASIYGWGLNFQHCNHVVYFPTHSYESYYQAVRRSWRFGQQHPVTVDVIASKAVEGILASLQRKAIQADRMFDALLSHMAEALRIARTNDHTTRIEAPPWLAS